MAVKHLDEAAQKRIKTFRVGDGIIGEANQIVVFRCEENGIVGNRFAHDRPFASKRLSSLKYSFDVLDSISNNSPERATRQIDRSPAS